VIRYTLLNLAVLFLVVYAWKDWYKSLCGLILFTALAERPDIPRSIFGVAGLNYWNLMMGNLLLAWFFSRRRERLRWDMPRYINVLILLYLAVILVATYRMLVDRTGLEDITTGELIADDLVNTLKWPLPGLMLFDGCRSRQRFRLGLIATLGVYVLLALQCARQISPSLDVSELERKSREVLERQTGYHRVDLSTMLAGASWAIFASRVLVRRGLPRLAVMGVAALVVYGQLLTAGRAGYVTCAAVGLILLSQRWRGYLMLLPVGAIAISLAVPAVVDRMFEGFGDEEELIDSGGVALDQNKVTAGRSRIWPYVIEKIQERPWIGWGRKAQRRTGLALFAQEELGDRFGHPHNAYLEMLLDSGIVGFVPVMLLYGVVLFQGLSLFRDSRSPVFVAAGGAALALTLAWLGGSIGSQTLYPRQSNLGMWCAVGLMLRVSIERTRAMGLARRAEAAAKADADSAATTPRAGRLPGPKPAAPAPPLRRPSLDELMWARHGPA